MEKSSSETLVDFQLTTWYFIPVDRTPYNHRCLNHKSYKENSYISWNLEFHYSVQKTPQFYLLLSQMNSAYIHSIALK
jgi:fatty-acid desaturase